MKLDAAPLIALVNAADVAPTTSSSHASSLARAWDRAVASGTVTHRMADHLAIGLLGVHPSAVWGDEWWSAQ